jgi:hypothetical protein
MTHSYSATPAGQNGSPQWVFDYPSTEKWWETVNKIQNAVKWSKASGFNDRSGSFDPSVRSGPSQNEYYHYLHNFLESIDFRENGPPEWIFDYYLSGEDEDEERYNQWQNQTPEQTDGISADGEEFLEEEWVHQQRAAGLLKAELVAQVESWPQQEPYWEGAPIHCSYTQVSIPYESLPQLNIGTSYQDPVYFKELDVVSMAIGRSGCYLKMLTEMYGLHYIWYQPNPLGLENPNLGDGCFELWGRKERLGEAVKAMSVHLAKTVDNIWEEWKTYDWAY